MRAKMTRARILALARADDACFPARVRILTTVPLRVWSYLGAFVALGALGYAIYIIIQTLTSGIQVPGYASLMVAILFLGGLQLLSLGVLGEYVGRILTETKGRPLYVIRERIGEGEEV